MLREIREFLVDSTFVEWALGWVAGEVVSRFLTSLVHDFFFPLVSGLFFNGANLDDLSVEINGTAVYWGALLTNAIDMIVVLFVVFIICQVICITRKRHKLEEQDTNKELVELTKTNAELLADIKELMAKQK